MYLQADEALGLVTECVKRFTGGQMMFDLSPVFFTAWLRRGSRTSLRYRVPQMPFTLSPSDIADLVTTVPGIRDVYRSADGAGPGQSTEHADVVDAANSSADPVRPLVTLLEFG